MTATSFDKVMHDKQTETSVMFAKMQCAGSPTGISKSAWLKIIERRSSELYGSNAALSQAQKFTKTITEDENGRLFYRALKFADGPEVEAPVEKVDAGPIHIGPAHAKMWSLGVDRQRERSIPFSAAYTEVYTNPANASLRAEVQREHLEHALAGIHGSVGLGGNAGRIDEAQRLAETEPTGGGKVRDFSASGTGDYSRDVARKSNSAEAALAALARAYQAKHPETKSYEIAFTKVMTAPENRQLAKRVEAERLAALGAA